MSEAYLTNWAMGRNFADRDRFHDVALHEARIATERQATPVRTVAGESLISRVRLALGRPLPVEACDCPAAA